MRVRSPAVPLEGDPRLETFFQALLNEGLALASVRAYRADLRGFVRWLNRACVSDVSLEKLTSADVARYRQHLTDERRLRPSTVNRHLEAIRRLCRWGHRHGHLKEDLARGMKPIRQVRRRRPAHLTKDEVHALLRAAGMSHPAQRRRNYALLRRDSRMGRLVRRPQWQTTQATAGCVEKTLFLCRLLSDNSLGAMIHEALHGIESWNSCVEFICFGRKAELQSNDPAMHQLSVGAIHLLQNALVLANTLMVERVLSDRRLLSKMEPDDRRALTPLFTAHVNPYGEFELDLAKPSFLREAA